MAKGVKGSGPQEDIPVRTSFIVKPSLTKKLRYIAVIDETTQTDIVNNLITDYIDKWEKKNGGIPVNNKT